MVRGSKARPRLINSLHSPGRHAYYNCKDRLYELAKCQEGDDRSAGVAPFQLPSGMKRGNVFGFNRSFMG